MPPLDASLIQSWHAHLYFDAASREPAWRLREAVALQFGDKVQIGRFHERPVGPHPQWSCQISFSPDRLAEVVSWLTLNRSSIDVFVHPNTDDELADHRDRAIWLGRAYPLDLRAVGG
jgi:DOPA 4,5-dioxygenase